MDERSETAPKRAYERPTLVPTPVFGDEGIAASCCKTTNFTCSAALKGTLAKATRTSTTT